MQMCVRLCVGDNMFDRVSVAFSIKAFSSFGQLRLEARLSALQIDASDHFSGRWISNHVAISF